MGCPMVPIKQARVPFADLGGGLTCVLLCDCMCLSVCMGVLRHCAFGGVVVHVRTRPYPWAGPLPAPFPAPSPPRPDHQSNTTQYSCQNREKQARRSSQFSDAPTSGINQT